MAFQYYDIEDQAATLLQTPLTDIAVVSVLFENEKQRDNAFKQANADSQAMVIVAYQGSDFDGSKMMNYMGQQDNITLICNVLSPKLRGTIGVHNVVDIIKTTLLGKQVAACSRFSLKNIEFQNRDESTSWWSYNVSFTCNKMQVQANPDGEDDTTELANLTQTTFDNKSFNNTLVD